MRGYLFRCGQSWTFAAYTSPKQANSVSETAQLQAWAATSCLPTAAQIQAQWQPRPQGYKSSNKFFSSESEICTDYTLLYRHVLLLKYIYFFQGKR